jgi:hypothetical protein
LNISQRNIILHKTTITWRVTPTFGAIRQSKKAVH